MANREFIYWCRDAISGIRYWKDRNKVFSELYEHLEDRYDYFIEKGHTHEEAQKKTLEAMGDPLELAPQLAAIHKPHWAYAAIATRILAIALAITCLCHGIAFWLDEIYVYPQKRWDPFEDGSGGERVVYMEPKTKVRDSGYTFSVEKVALWRKYYPEPTDKGEYFDTLFVGLKVTNPLPWMREQTAVRNMWAVDSTGTYYASYASYEDPAEELPWVHFSPLQTGVGTWTYEIGFQHTSVDMQWIELHYDRDGRDLVLRIDLTGGESK